ncbi:MAG: HNH endonuclease, partial [Acidimicrobiales bacterium]
MLSANASAYAERSADERLEAIQQTAGVLNAAHAELLDLVAAAESEQDWESDGAWGSVPWLVGQLGIARPTATEWHRVARALQELPALRAAYGRAELSWDQLRAATRFVTPDDDAHHAELLPGFSASQIQTLARQCRPIPASDAREAHANRGLSWRRDHRRGGFVYRGFVPFDQGEAINQALVSVADDMGPDAATDTWDPLRVRLADALHDLAARHLGTRSSPDRACVVIHADAAVVDGTQPGNGFIGDLAINQDGVLRALCDCRVEVALHGPDGATVGIARASQNVPWWLRRQVHHRDGTCRFPGCERRIRQIHHLHHWSRGGPTNLDNLVGLCWTHHHLVHEGGWTVEGSSNRALTFVRPGGHRRLRSCPTA